MSEEKRDPIAEVLRERKAVIKSLLHSLSVGMESLIKKRESHSNELYAVDSRIAEDQDSANELILELGIIDDFLRKRKAGNE